MITSFTLSHMVFMDIFEKCNNNKLYKSLSPSNVGKCVLIKTDLVMLNRYPVDS